MIRWSEYDRERCFGNAIRPGVKDGFTLFLLAQSRDDYRVSCWLIFLPVINQQSIVDLDEKPV